MTFKDTCIIAVTFLCMNLLVAPFINGVTTVCAGRGVSHYSRAAGEKVNSWVTKPFRS